MARELNKDIYEITSKGAFAKDQNYITEEQFKIIFNMIEEISKMLSGLIKYLGAKK